MWFIGVEVEQETSAPPPEKNPGSVPVSVHAWTSHANILHLDQKAAKCATCEQLCGSFSF